MKSSLSVTLEDLFSFEEVFSSFPICEQLRITFRTVETVAYFLLTRFPLAYNFIIRQPNFSSTDFQNRKPIYLLTTFGTHRHNKTLTYSSQTFYECVQFQVLRFLHSLTTHYVYITISIKNHLKIDAANIIINSNRKKAKLKRLIKV